MQRRRLPPPAASAVYELTDWGLDLEPVLQALGRWGVRAPTKPPSNDIGLDSFVLALRTMFDPATAGDLDTTGELHLGDQTFRACVSGGVLTVERGRAAGPAAVVTGDVGGLAAVTFGGLPVREARLGGLLSVEGDEQSVASFTRCFPLPQTSSILHDRGGHLMSRHRPTHHSKGDIMQKIIPNLWFDTEGEAAANYYVSLFDDSRVVEVTHYGSAGPRPEGMVLTVTFELDGQRFTAINGGPDFPFSEAMSLLVECEDQAEVDRFWEAFSESGEPGPCGWIKDKYGLSWQVAPRRLDEMIADPDPQKSQAAMKALMSMGKIDVAELERAYAAA